MHRGLAVLLPLLVLATGADAHPIGSPSYVNFLLDDFATPALAPGEGDDLRFTLTNTYPWDMQAVRLRLEVYRYLEIDVDRPVSAEWPYARPSFRDAAGVEHGLAYEPAIPDLAPQEAVNVSVTVLTDAEMPHGTITAQGSYFVRTWLEFDLTDGTTTNSSVMASKGFFTDTEWATAREPCDPVSSYCVGLLNFTYLGSVYGLDHLDGLLPDTGFSVKDRFPAWPFYAVGGVMATALVSSVLFYAEENPGRLPRLARWWLGVKGRLRQARPPRGPK